VLAGPVASSTAFSAIHSVGLWLDLSAPRGSNARLGHRAVVSDLAPAQPLLPAGEPGRSDPTCRYVFMITPEGRALELTSASSRRSALSEKKRVPAPSKTG